MWYKNLNFHGWWQHQEIRNAKVFTHETFQLTVHLQYDADYKQQRMFYTCKSGVSVKEDAHASLPCLVTVTELSGPSLTLHHWIHSCECQCVCVCQCVMNCVCHKCTVHTV